MEVLNISQDDNDSDTSQEDFEDDCYKEQDTDMVSKDDYSFTNWKRPDIQFDVTKDIDFMMIDCDFGILPTTKIQESMIPFLHPELQKINIEQSYLRLYGLTEKGNSVCCNVFNFLPYFYAMPIPGLTFTESDVKDFKNALNEKIIYTMLNQIKSVPFHNMITTSDPVVDIEFIRETPGENLKIFDLVELGQSSGYSILLKIICRVPKFVWVAADLLKQGKVEYPRITGSEDDDKRTWKYEIYEGSINHTIRFLTDLNLSGCSWVKIENRKYFIRTDQKQKLSHAQLEVDVLFNDIIQQPLKQFIPPMRILSYDIEVMVQPPTFDFPAHGAEQILQIANVFCVHSNEESTNSELKKVVFSLKCCDEIPGATIYSFGNEKKLLDAWRSFLLIVDPDIITGYNIKKFDFPYLIERANCIDISSQMPFLGRMKGIPSGIRMIQNKWKRFNLKDIKTLNLNGRVIFDMMLLVIRHNTIPSRTYTKDGEFSLNEVSKRYLNQQKDDVKYYDIYELHHAGPDTRKELAKYCIQDAILPFLLMMKIVIDRNKPDMNVLEYYIRKSRESSVPLKYLVTKSLDYHTYYKRIHKTKNPETLSSSPVKVQPSKTPVRENESCSSCRKITPKKFKFW